MFLALFFSAHLEEATKRDFHPWPRQMPRNFFFRVFSPQRASHFFFATFLLSAPFSREGNFLSFFENSPGSFFFLAVLQVLSGRLPKPRSVLPRLIVCPGRSPFCQKGLGFF